MLCIREKKPSVTAKHLSALAAPTLSPSNIRHSIMRRRRTNDCWLRLARRAGQLDHTTLVSSPRRWFARVKLVAGSNADVSPTALSSKRVRALLSETKRT